MKSVIITTFISLFVFGTSLAQISPERLSYQKKVRQYSAMQTAGIIMGASGLATTTTGIVLLASMYGDHYDNIAKGVGGVLLIIVGVPLTAGGTTLGIIGSVKKMKYKAKLENLSFNLKYDGHQTGFVMRYQF